MYITHCKELILGGGGKVVVCFEYFLLGRNLQNIGWTMIFTFMHGLRVMLLFETLGHASNL
jgi:hypothetical protein